jgi:hypothetical protein
VLSGALSATCTTEQIRQDNVQKYQMHCPAAMDGSSLCTAIGAGAKLQLPDLRDLSAWTLCVFDADTEDTHTGCQPHLAPAQVAFEWQQVRGGGCPGGSQDVE